MTKKEFQDALLSVQSKLKAPKNQYNLFGKYNYRNAEDILEAAKPLLINAGLLMSISDEIVQVGDRYYVKATVTIEDGEGNLKSVSAQAREEEDKKGMDGSQVTGASSSYARKYALNGLFLIDDTKDSDSTNDGSGPAKKTATKTPAKTTAPAVSKETTPSKQEATSKEKPKLELGSAAFNGAVKWVASSKEMVFDAIDKLKSKYDIAQDVYDAIAKASEAIRQESK